MTTIETRTAEITAALHDLAKKSTITTEDLPEVLQNSAIAGVEAVQNAIHAIGYHMSLEQAARFFATVYTEQDRDAFLAAYEAAAPSCYDQEADLETSAPWCCPWLTGAMGAEEGDTPESLGRKAALIDYRGPRDLLRGRRRQPFRPDGKRHPRLPALCRQHPGLP